MNAKQLADRVLPPNAKKRILRSQRRSLDMLVNYRMRVGRLGPLPSFLIIGYGKCGTTYLFDRLLEHPNVYPSVKKEINYFIFRHAEGVNWYRAHFASAPNGRSDRLVAVGEASPGYVVNPHAPGRIAALIPNVKLIVLVRNPVDRAYSHYRHQRRLGIEPLASFEAALEAETDRLRGERERLFSDPSYVGSFAWYIWSYVAQGIYADHLQWWLDEFPSDQLLVVPSDALYQNPTSTLRNVTRFLELPDWTPRERFRHKSFPYPKMEPATRDRLSEFFAPHNERLFAMLGTDYGWNSGAPRIASVVGREGRVT